MIAKIIKGTNFSGVVSYMLSKREDKVKVLQAIGVRCSLPNNIAHDFNLQASDYNLCYRYLRMQGKATTVDFTHLDSIFITHRNSKAIQQLKQKFVSYEQALQRQAELVLQQDKIKQEQRELKKHLKK